MDKLELMKKANEVRKSIVTAVHSAKSGHPGGSLSAADIYTYLFFEEMNVDRQIRRRRTVTVSYCQRDIRRRDIMRLWHTGDSSR